MQFPEYVLKYYFWGKTLINDASSRFSLTKKKNSQNEPLEGIKYKTLLLRRAHISPDKTP